MLQVARAFEWLSQPNAHTFADVAVYADEPRKGGRGVVLREAQETSGKRTTSFYIIVCLSRCFSCSSAHVFVAWYSTSNVPYCSDTGGGDACGDCIRKDHHQ